MNMMFNNYQNMIQQIKQFKSMLRGDPNQQLQQMIDSGQVSQEMLNHAQQMAKPLYELMK
ncbi:MAG: hypothetical protein IJP92_00895 [Lachnospiraceae bacterium]|nr:hypothetical protein [Lachnospiraceae bacterium]